MPEICLKHILGWSKRRKSEIFAYDKEHHYCPGCIPDEGNKRCPFYEPTRIYYIEVGGLDGSYNKDTEKKGVR